MRVRPCAPWGTARTTESLTYDLNGAVLFSHLDLNKAFHQLELDESNRDVTTVNTHMGYYRFKRLHMGVSSAPELFQHVIEHRVLGGMEGARIFVNDILVWRRTAEKHDDNLFRTCVRLQEYGLTATMQEFRVKELVFFGLKVSGKGVAPADEKVEAIVKTDPSAAYG